MDHHLKSDIKATKACLINNSASSLNTTINYPDTINIKLSLLLSIFVISVSIDTRHVCELVLLYRDDDVIQAIPTPINTTNS